MRRRGLLRTLGLMAFLIGFWGRPGAAEPIQITGGRLEMGSLTGTLMLAGDRGFTLTAGVGVVDAFFGPWVQCNVNLTCFPRSVINLGAVFVGNSLHATTVTIDGETFTNVTSAAATSGAAITFTGSAVAPPFGADTAAVQAPFFFEGSFAYPQVPGDIRPGESLYGQGTATIFLQRSIVNSASWRYSAAQYEFEPVPEPATILLTGTGIVWLARRTIRRRRVTAGA